MTNLLSDGIAWLDEQRVSHLSDLVVYARVGYNNLTLAATMGKTTREIMDDSGQTIESTAIDFLVSASALVLDGSVRKPEIGDRITVTHSPTITRVYEVLDMMGEGHFAWADSRGVILRIHTKLVEEVNA